MRILSNPGETPRNPPGFVLSAAGAVAIKSNRPPYRRPTATEILKLMERKGLIYREEASYDARCKKIIPTEKGWELEGRVLKDILEMEQFITRDIPKEELDTFIRIGMKMMKNLK